MANRSALPMKSLKVPLEIARNSFAIWACLSRPRTRRWGANVKSQWGHSGAKSKRQDREDQCGNANRHANEACPEVENPAILPGSDRRGLKRSKVVLNRCPAAKSRSNRVGLH